MLVCFYLLCFQVINNACATQAIVSVLLNCTHADLLVGDTLTEFREFSQSFDAAVRIDFHLLIFFFQFSVANIKLLLAKLISNTLSQCFLNICTAVTH